MLNVRGHSGLARRRVTRRLGPQLDRWGAFAIHIGHVLDLLEKPLAQLELLTAARYAKDVENPFAVLELRVQTMLRDFQGTLCESGDLLEKALAQLEPLMTAGTPRTSRRLGPKPSAA